MRTRHAGRRHYRELMVLLALVPLSKAALAAVPPVPVPLGNPVTAAKAELGKILFWDEQLSSDQTVACGTCHLPAQGGSDPRDATAPGADGVFGTVDDVAGSFGVVGMDASGYTGSTTFGLDPQVTGRAAPTIYGSLWSPLQFWDGRAGPALSDPDTGAVVLPNRASLEAQALAPLLNDVEMSHAGRSWSTLVTGLQDATPLALATDLPADVATAIAAAPTYPALFTRAFGSSDITATRIAMAIATYERTLVPDQTPYDAFMAGDATALTAQEARGLNVLRTSPCGVCHAGDLFTDNSFRNIGLRPVADDAGRFDITGVNGDRGRFKVPSLRNVGLKSEFMHTGTLTSLREVLDFYLGINGQVQSTDNQDPLIARIAFPPPAQADLLAFLANGLTDPRVAAETAPFDRPTLHARTGACADGIDNDGDGLVDLADGGCLSGADSTETTYLDLCDDGLDNDHDGVVDGADADCDQPMCVGDVTSGDLDDDGLCNDLDLLLDVGVVAPGVAVTLTATGAPAGSAVSFLVSTRGRGTGPCLPSAGICAGIVAPTVIGTVTAGVDGAAVRTVQVPASVTPGAQVAFQAGWVDAGTGETSNIVLRTVQP